MVHVSRLAAGQISLCHILAASSIPLLSSLTLWEGGGQVALCNNATFHTPVQRLSAFPREMWAMFLYAVSGRNCLNCAIPKNIGQTRPHKVYLARALAIHFSRGRTCINSSRVRYTPKGFGRTALSDYYSAISHRNSFRTNMRNVDDLFTGVSAEGVSGPAFMTS